MHTGYKNILVILVIILLTNNCKSIKTNNFDCRSSFIYETLYINAIEDGYRNIAIKVQYNNNIDSLVLCSECAFDIFQLKNKSYRKYIKTFHSLIYHDNIYQVDSMQYIRFSEYKIHHKEVLNTVYNNGKVEFIEYCKDNSMKFTSQEIDYAIFLLYGFNVFAWKKTTVYGYKLNISTNDCE